MADVTYGAGEIRATTDHDRTRPGQTRVKMAGMGVGMKPAYATHRDGRVEFGALLKAQEPDGLAVRIDAPVLTVAQATAWVKRRMQGFADHPGARESTEEAVRRKVIAAQGERHTRQLRAALDKDGRMELDMMLSAEAHHQGAPWDARVPLVVVDAKGNLGSATRDFPRLVDTEGSVFDRADST